MEEAFRNGIVPQGQLLPAIALPAHALLDAMLQYPVLINRPIVVTPKGVKLCRPSEIVLSILENPEIGTFVKEDGEVVRR